MILLQDVNIPILLYFGSSVMLFIIVGVVVFIVVYQRRMFRQQKKMIEIESQLQRDLLEASIKARENEQQRIAEDLHDDIGSLLSALKLQIMRTFKSFDVSEKNESIKDTRNLLNQAIEQTRMMSRELLPVTLKMVGIEAAIEELVKRINSSGNLKFEIFKEGKTQKLTDQQALMLFRILQELINNILKHANATRADLTFGWNLNELNITIKDNGTGFEVDKELKATKSLGLKNIISRASLIHADVDYQTGLNKSTLVKIKLPLA